MLRYQQKQFEAECAEIETAIRSLVRPPGWPRINRIAYVLGEDLAGYPLVDLHVILPDDTPEEFFSKGPLPDVAHAIADHMREAGIASWPHLRFHTESGQKQVEECEGPPDGCVRLS